MYWWYSWLISLKWTHREKTVLTELPDWVMIKTNLGRENSEWFHWWLLLIRINSNFVFYSERMYWPFPLKTPEAPWLISNSSSGHSYLELVTNWTRTPKKSPILLSDETKTTKTPILLLLLSSKDMLYYHKHLKHGGPSCLIILTSDSWLIKSNIKVTGIKKASKSTNDLILILFHNGSMNLVRNWRGVVARSMLQNCARGMLQLGDEKSWRNLHDLLSITASCISRLKLIPSCAAVIIQKCRKITITILFLHCTEVQTKQWNCQIFNLPK